jgi:hypothetical protein
MRQVDGRRETVQELNEREPTTRQKDVHPFANLARFGRYSKYFSSKYFPGMLEETVLPDKIWIEAIWLNRPGLKQVDDKFFKSPFIFTRHSKFLKGQSHQLLCYIIGSITLAQYLIQNRS